MTRLLRLALACIAGLDFAVSHGGARLDLSWTRSAGPWSLGLAVQNVFDRVLYSGQAAPDYIPLEPRRRWVLSARYANWSYCVNKIKAL